MIRAAGISLDPRDPRSAAPPTVHDLPAESLEAAAPSQIPPPAAVPRITREQWLHGAVDLLRPAFLAQGVPVPPAVQVSMGFPSTRALARRVRIGECWAPEAWVPLLGSSDWERCSAKITSVHRVALSLPRQ